jgi:alpha-glucosidase
MYSSGPLPSGEWGGPLNPSEPLYSSIPLLIETNPTPQGSQAGPPYSYGIFFDNPAQSYFNIGANDYSNMDGKYYFGALYGDMDYYFMLGGRVPDVLKQYTDLTGRSPMPPKYVFGFHQGCYGYFDRYRLALAANAYRAAAIPIDGLHIDVDFQNNYRTFTHSEIKFTNAPEMMSNLHQLGFKCSTNITPLLTDNSLDENAQSTVYAQRAALLGGGGLLFDTRAGEGESPNLFEGQVSYGQNSGNNPYPYPPLHPNNDGMTPLGAFGNYPNLGAAAVRTLWGQQYAHLVNDLGMDMIWQDMTCPALAQGNDTPDKTFPLDLEQDTGITGIGYQPNATFHNVYVLNLLRATWEGLQALRNTSRNFIIARGGYAGFQRYAALWTGDSASSWDFLALNLPEVLNLGLSGVPISGCDIGGFAVAANDVPQGTTKLPSFAFGKVYDGITNYELLTRWMHLGSFLPWYRNHYDGYNKQFQEPYAYGEPVPTNCRKYIELRYRMLQIYYDAMYEWTQTGMPIARALFLNDPDDPGVYYHLDDQFFVGRDFLVAPILSQHDTLPNPTPPLRNVYLPAGSQWYSFKDNQYPLDAPVPGGTLVTNYYASLNLVPIYVRAGAILPFRGLEQYVGQLASNPLTFNIYPGPDSSYQLYQDDGISQAAASSSTYRLTTISHTGVPGGQSIRVQRGVDKFPPPEQYFFIALLGTRHPVSVALNGANLQDVKDPATLASSNANAYYWNAGIQVTFAKIFDTNPDVTLAVQF